MICFLGVTGKPEEDVEEDDDDDVEDVADVDKVEVGVPVLVLESDSNRIRANDDDDDDEGGGAAVKVAWDRCNKM